MILALLFCQHFSKCRVELLPRCPHCTVVRDFAHDLVKHIAEGHGHEEEIRMALRGEGAPDEGGSKVDCPACGLSQPLSSVGDHYKSCIEQLYQSFDAGQQKKKILCTTCGKALPKSRYICRGINNHIHIYLGTVLFATNRYKEHLMIHLREQREKDGEDTSDLFFYCDKCDRKYARLSILKEHIQRDHGEGPKRTYNCKECPATFVRRRSLYYHMNMKHDKDNKFRLVPPGWRI